MKEIILATKNARMNNKETKPKIKKNNCPSCEIKPQVIVETNSIDEETKDSDTNLIGDK